MLGKIEKILKKVWGYFLASALCVCMLPAAVYAAGDAHFYVQAADVQEDGTMEVVVYLTDAKNMGGVEAELIYDASKVSYVDAQLGTSLKTKLADVYHDEAQAKVKYVAVYQKAQKPHGALMKVTFRLKEGEAYQPTLNVMGLVDDSDEVKAIPFDITYQHADGTWQGEADTSGVQAEETVIQQALKDYGSDADQKEAAAEKGNAAAGSARTETDGTEEGVTSDAASDQESEDASGDETEGQNQGQKESQEEKQKKQQNSKAGMLVGVVVLIAAAAAAGIVIFFVRKKKNNDE